MRRAAFPFAQLEAVTLMSTLVIKNVGHSGRNTYALASATCRYQITTRVVDLLRDASVQGIHPSKPHELQVRERLPSAGAPKDVTHPVVSKEFESQPNDPSPDSIMPQMAVAPPSLKVDLDPGRARISLSCITSLLATDLVKTDLIQWPPIRSPA